MRFTVDAAHCQRASDELYAILLKQERAFVERLYSRLATEATVKVLSILGGLVSLIGLLLAVWNWFARSHRLWLSFDTINIVLFLAFMTLFMFLPGLTPHVRAWSSRRAERRCRRRAERLVRVAKRLAPFEAEYEIKGDLLTYARGKEGKWNLAWHRKLSKYCARGVAVQGECVTVIFRRANSIMPAIVILHRDPKPLHDAIKEIGIPIFQ